MKPYLKSNIYLISIITIPDLMSTLRTGASLRTIKTSVESYFYRKSFMVRVGHFNEGKK